MEPMRRAIDRTNLEVFPVGLGAMPLSLADRPSEDRARAVLAAALEAGVELIDTADAYCIDDGDTGHNERLIAAFLREHAATDRIVVATKGGLTRPGGDWASDARPEHLRAACEASLKRLGVAAIRLYQLHAPDPDVPFEDSVGELARLREAGKIEHVGLSNVDADEVRRALDIVPVVSVQNRCNILDRSDLASGFVDFCAAQGITYIAYAPVGGHNGHARLSDIGDLAEVARRHGASIYRTALAWLLAQGEHIVPIPGASRVESIRDSTAAPGLALDAEDLARLDAMAL